MKNIVKISLYVAVIIITASLILQYFLVDKMFSAEHDNIKVRASLVLNDVLSLDLKRLGMERHDILEKRGIDVKSEVWGGSFDNKTVTVYVAYPEQRIYERKCETEEEWYEYTKEVYCRYHITGINLSRLDSAYKIALEKYSISLPFVLVKIDSTNTVLEQIPADVDFNNFKLSADAIPLGIDGKDFLVARFDNSYYGMFRQMRFILISSFVIVFLLAFITFFLLRTIFYQHKVTEIRERFVRIIVHDLKNPVMHMRKIFNRIVANGSHGDDINAGIRKSEHMSLMIEKLLTTSSMTKTFSIVTELMSVGEYVGEIIEQYKIEDEELDIRYLYENGLESAYIDTFHFRGAVMNLIDNAKKYTKKKPDIYVRCYKKDNYICISVKDSGIGIPKKYMRYLFEKDFRVPEKRTLNKYGFGVGLNYVMIVARAHGGDVKVESEYDKGSEFVIMIPAIPKG